MHVGPIFVCTSCEESILLVKRVYKMYICCNYKCIYCNLLDDITNVYSTVLIRAFLKCTLYTLQERVKMCADLLINCYVIILCVCKEEIYIPK